MRCEIPILLRCCCCFPLRYGLLVWAYIKQILNLLFLAFNIMIFYMDYQRLRIGGYLFLSAMIILTIVDIVFHGFFIISAHRKDYRKIRIFYRYSIVLLCLTAVIMGLYVGSSLMFISYMSSYFSIFLFYILLPVVGMTLTLILSQAYLIILVRSEFMKLKNKSQFEFVNNAAEEKCTANINFEEGIPA